MRVTVLESSKESFDSDMKDKILVFLDFEFNCPEQKGTNKREIISMGAVFRYSDGSPLTSFYSLVKPSRNSRISDRTRRLTGITQKQLNKSQNFDVVSEKFLHLVDCFSPSEYFVWGSADKAEVQKSVRYSKADNRMTEISGNFHDLQIDVMKELNLDNPYNLERVADIYDIDFVHTFSAIDDAECLAEIYFAYKRGIYDSEKLDLYKKCYEYRKIIGNYKLIANNIKNSGKKLETLKKLLSETPDGSDEYNKLKVKSEETAGYISEQQAMADMLKPLADEGKIFLDENNFII